MKTERLNKTVLITGGTSGIGYELAKIFAENGYNLVLVARMQDRLQEVAQEMKTFGGEVWTISADLFDHKAAKYVYNQVHEKGITVDILVNDAGQGVWGKFTETELDRQLEIIQLNIMSLVSLTYLFLQDMLVRNDGKILQMGSVVSKMPAPYSAVYSGTKAFVLFFTHSIIKEIENSNVTMTVLMPGATDTDFFHKAGADKSKVYSEGKLSDPKDVAQTGYDALMDGKSNVVEGFKNKFMTTLADIMPMTTDATMSYQEHKPTDKPVNDRRTHSEHEPSLRERENLKNKKK